MERLFEQFKPVSYQLVLDVQTTERTIHGLMVVVGVPKGKEVKLHANGLKILEVGQNKRKLNFTQTDDILTVHDITPPSATKNDDKEVADRDDKLGARPDTITLSIAWQAPIATERMTGAYLSTYNVGEIQREIVATQFESHYARNVFPCVDEPEAKAEFHLVLIHDPTADALGNTPIATRLQLENQRIRTAFHKTPPMSTYLLAFAIGGFHSVSTTSTHGTQITTYATACHPDSTLTFANEIAARALDFYVDHFGVPYPLAKLDQVALPDFEAGAMENWGLITYRESMLIAGEKASLDTKKQVALTIAHEISHQWFGNLVTMRWWDDLWLNESFATYIEYVCVNTIFPEWKVMDDFYLEERAYAMARDLLPNVQTVRQNITSPDEIQTLFDGAIVYAKGACLLGQLVSEIGAETFYAGLRSYFTKHAFKNTTADDLWAELPNAKNLMDYWLTHPHYPLIEGDKQHEFTLHGRGHGSKYPLPTIKTDLSGYYLLPVTAEKINNFAAATPEERARLLTDARILAEASELPIELALNLVAELQDETDYLVWSAATYLINFLRTFIEPDTLQEQQFKTVIGRAAQKCYAKLGMNPLPDDTPHAVELRTTILHFMAYSENPDVINQILQIDVNNLKSLNPDTRAVILATHVRFDFGAAVDNLFTQYTNTADPELQHDIAAAVTATKRPDMVAMILSRLLDKSTVRPQDILSFISGLLANPIARLQTFTWIRGNWPELDRLFRGHDLAYYPRLLGRTLRTVPELGEFRDFFKPLEKQTDIAREISIAEPAIEARINLLIKQGDAFRTRLAELIAGTNL
ncbi:MAG: M1 family metallopeptidase [Candidatus Nomurabacteria bacterium]|jgi:aminopeptidase N|nr:M1 family metallopeptidase [Candidatus Nomurabacteria bacterium]